ncbi:MAG: FAD-dependent oxidoreductase [Planctomycetota bacterium]|jgi:NADPH-dependent glutamate synthase beta subunit-like oxidoreductase/ferredoxin
MPRLVIDNREVEVPNGSTILDAAAKLGIEIPTMCFLKGHKALTSCMICVVRVAGIAKLVPACGTIAEDGMRVESNCDEVKQARRAALELMLSEHVGDCMGPCQVTCPAQMNIPLMIRQIAAGQFREAIETVKKDIALPAVLGRICPAPCERTCRRAQADSAVSICLLKRYAADVDLESDESYMPACQAKQDKRVAIVGAGPAGLAAAYYLLRQGYACTVFDERESPGGMLRYGVTQEELPRDVLDAEIGLIAKLGANFKMRTRIGTAISMADLQKDFDAVFIAVGEMKAGDAEWLGLDTKQESIVTKGRTYQTSLSGVFAGGDAVRKRRLTVRAVADGKEAAAAIGQFLSGQEVTGQLKSFNTHIGRLREGEMEIFLASASNSARVLPALEGGGFSDEQARAEAVRCLHCDCRKPKSCKLRKYSHQHQARPRRYKSELPLFTQQLQHPEVIYEPGKCIRCGLCIQITAEAKEKLGLTFIGRGFDARVAVPFDHSIAEGLKQTARKCVQACPTGALAFKEELPGA